MMRIILLCFLAMSPLVSSLAPSIRRSTTSSSSNRFAPILLQSVSKNNDDADLETDITTSPSPEKRFHCYLLRSLDPEHPLKTYVGYTTDPIRRLRQHNGELKHGGAKRTARNGRPWQYAAIVDGFQDKVSAMKFEWAWQHTHRSKVFREAVGDDALAKRMKRRRGVKARFDELRVLLECEPFNCHPLEVYFPEEASQDLFYSMLNGNGNDNATQEIKTSVCPVDEMPFAAEQKPRPTMKAQKVNGSWAQMHFNLSLLPTTAPTRGHFLGQRRHQSNWALNAVTPQTSNFFATSGLNRSADESQTETNQNASAVDKGSEQAAIKVPAKFKPYPFEYHQEFVVTIDSLTNLGFGIARIELDEPRPDTPVATDTNKDIPNDDPKKWVIFVPNVIPGEKVRIRIYRNYATYSDADLLEIIEASPDRIEPVCELANKCGGCQYQHIKVDRQRQMKTIQVQELFERLGGLSEDEFPSVLPTLGTDEVFGYRSKITPHYDAPMKKRGRKNKETYQGIPCEIGPIGFKEKASRRLVDVPYCHIATPAINEALARVRDETREAAREGKLKKPTKGATLLFRDAGDGVETDNNVYVKTTVKDLVFRFKAGNFFQNNPFMLPKMVDLVVDAATAPSPTGKAMTHLIDCYCGSGLFAIGSSSSFEACVGIEVNELAVEEARENAALNNIENCAFVSASAEAIFDPATLEGESDMIVGDFPRETTVVVIDPPRKGCSVEFLEQLHAYKPQRLVYMSCDPATQARDTKYIVSYGYEIVSVQPFDLFPQTRHIECLATFELKS